MKPAISIIIVNYNNGDVLPACLNAVRKWVDGSLAEIIVVDNDSSDGSPARLAAVFPEVQWVMAGENMGFGRANNLGASTARGDYLFFLNPDTELLSPVPALLKALLEQDAYSQVGVAGVSIVNEFEKADVAAGNFPTPATLLQELFPARLFPYTLRTAPLSENVVSVDYVSGADLFFRRFVFEQAGGFDPDFFLYYEETELQYRVAKMGYQRVLLTDARLKHLCGTPDHKVSDRKIRIFETSRLLFHRKCYGPAGGLWARIWLVLFYGSRLLTGGPRHYLTGIKTAFQS